MAEKNIANINELKETVESELISGAAVEEKKYNLRPLVATDMGQICKIITAVGVRQFKEAFNQDDIKGKSD